MEVDKCIENVYIMIFTATAFKYHDEHIMVSPSCTMLYSSTFNIPFTIKKGGNVMLKHSLNYK